ncbi:MAG TPA: PhzF family phenazine biosynthesis protein [Fimbriimonas sp.]|nr:PhzF family phenazine biosynthesis protein [Fimbriimonas sp.]
MNLPIYVIDAFSKKPFAGNPAAVVPLDSAGQISDQARASIAEEMKHAETAYLAPRGGNEFDLRWFTPAVEVDLCGHATLASAHILWETARVADGAPIAFFTRSGKLTATRDGEKIVLDFPAEPVEPSALPFQVACLPAMVFSGRNRMDWFVEVESAAELRSLEPNFAEIERLGMRGLIVTSRGDEGYDFVSRFFAPQAGVPEDPVTGSAHCALAAYWAAKLGKDRMQAFQASERGGEVGVRLAGTRVELSGHAVTVLQGQLRL